MKDTSCCYFDLFNKYWTPQVNRHSCGFVKFKLPVCAKIPLMDTLDINAPQQFDLALVSMKITKKMRTLAVKLREKEAMSKTSMMGLIKGTLKVVNEFFPSLRYQVTKIRTTAPSPSQQCQTHQALPVTCHNDLQERATCATHGRYTGAHRDITCTWAPRMEASFYL